MTRTAAKSLPAGVVPPVNALVYSLALSAAGIALGFFMLGLLPGFGLVFLCRSIHHVAQEEDLA
jgi:heme O synthase-like polyprenyltransferase